MFKAHLKLLVLQELSKNSLSGYDIMNNLFQSLNKKPSPGYIYPLLKDLEKNRFIKLKKVQRRKVYSITNKGDSLLNDLQNKKNEMVTKISGILKPLDDKNELKDLINFKKNPQNHDFLENRTLLFNLYRSVFNALKYNDRKKNNQVKSILKQSIKKIEGLK